MGRNLRGARAPRCAGARPTARWLARGDRDDHGARVAPVLAAVESAADRRVGVVVSDHGKQRPNITLAISPPWIATSSRPSASTSAIAIDRISATLAS